MNGMVRRKTLWERWLSRRASKATYASVTMWDVHEWKQACRRGEATAKLIEASRAAAPRT